MAVLPFGAVFGFCFLLLPWLSPSRGLHTKCIGQPISAALLGASLKFQFGSLFLCRKRQRGEIFPSEVLLQYSCAAKGITTGIPVSLSCKSWGAGNKCNPWS